MKTTQADIVSLVEFKHDLAIKLWREGKPDEARPLLHEAIEGAANTDKRLAYTNTLSIVERSAGKLAEAIQLINAALPEAMALNDKHRLAKLHMTQGINYRNLGDAKKSDELRQQALIHFAGAVGFFEELKDSRHVSLCENNLSNVLTDLNKPDEALIHSNRAIKINRSLQDRTEEDDILLLQFMDTRAKAYVASPQSRESTHLALGDSLRSSLGLYEAAETNFLQTSLKTLRRCLARLEYEAEGEMLQNAFDRAGGQPKKAADLLNMNHGTFIRLANKHPELRRKPKKKPRGRQAKKAQQH